MKTKTYGKNTYGKNRFREVEDRCLQCNGKHTTNMQCDTGVYDWHCEICGEKTQHEITEVHSLEVAP